MASERRRDGSVPHPIPYQGSKRALAPRILSVVQGLNFKTLYEPFAGSAALSLAAAKRRLAGEFRISDSLAPLVGVWKMIVQEPERLAAEYAEVWNGQLDGGDDYYVRVRDDYNRGNEPALLLYLLARCVKNAPRFNKEGLFNQSADRRRLGMRPAKMEREILGASALLRDRARVDHGDFEESLRDATAADLVYMDPPWQGTTDGPHKRYHQGLSRTRLITALEGLNARKVPFLLSYDGRCGDKTYGEPLSAELGLLRLELHAGRSSQSTLAGREENTVESLYVSPALSRRTKGRLEQPGGQLELWARITA